jgi:imidazolonepropionase-like amidohydrolase
MPFLTINKCNHVVARPSCACCTAEVRSMTSRVNRDLSRRGFVAGMTAAVTSIGLPNLALAQTSVVSGAKAPPTLFTNVNLFDGIDLNLHRGVSVLVDGDRIVSIDTGDATAPDGATVIDGGGRTLMPGLIDVHWHTMLAALPIAVMLTADVGFIHLSASAQAERTLMRGFTTVRDLGGPAFALKRAIDSGIIAGPRIFPCGAIISQTSGHGDFRNIWEAPRQDGAFTRSEVLGASMIVDGRDAVLRATREQLMAGATQIKLAAGGGVASTLDPLDTMQFLPEEIEAAVLAAADWGTYVCAHVYMPASIQRCIKAGVKSIEHGQIADEESVMMMADNGVAWSLQPFLPELNMNVPKMGQAMLDKWKRVWDGTDNSYNLAIKHGVVTGFGCDFLFDPATADGQGAWLAALQRWYTPAQVLMQATSQNAFILNMSGARNPYAGKLGVIEKDAFADMLLVDGDPTVNVDLVTDPDTNFKIIMKGGQIYKNTL